MTKYLRLVFIVVLQICGLHSLEIYLNNNGPAVRGSNITFTATVPNYNGENVKYQFFDNAQPQNAASFQNSTSKIEWIVAYPRSLYEAGEYTATVYLMKNFYGFWYCHNSTDTIFNLTS